MQINGLILADMHWGAIDPDEFYEQITHVLYKYLQDQEVNDNTIDYIIIAGDLFDTKETFSSLVVERVIAFLFDLLYITDPWDTEIYIIEGTRTHDNLQLSNLGMIFNYVADNFNSKIHIVQTVDEVNIHGSIRTLFIPEEYVIDKDAYYKKYLSEPNKYDLIVGHGMIDKIWYAKQNSSPDNDLVKHMSAPVFTVEELLNAGNRCYFGHIHTNKAYGDNDRFHYIGPTTRWEFGSTTRVGFYHVSFNDVTRKFTDDFIDNTEAKEYPTIALSINEEITLTDLNDKIDTMLAEIYIKCRNIAKVRMVVNLSQSVPTWQSIRDFLISKFGSMNHVKFILNLEEMTPEETQEIEEAVQNNRYIFDHSIDIPQRVHLFIKNKSGKDIPVEKIRYYLGEAEKK